MQKFFAHGKLLITGEYFVLAGAKALAIPTHKGQHLQVEETEGKHLSWNSIDEQGNSWLTATFDLQNLEIIEASDQSLAEQLQSFFKYIQKIKPGHFSKPVSCTTTLEFDRAWGWGSSSTLISLLSQWSGVPAYDLLKNTTGGSGYDIACAQAEGPVFYQLKEAQPKVTSAPFPKLFLHNLFLVYLGNKQKSSTEIEKFQAKGEVNISLIRQVSHWTNMVARSADLATFCACLQELERFTGDYIGQAPLQDELFKNLPGAAKSLGAWGGDFALLATPWPETKVKQFCNDLGLTTVFNFEDIVKL